MTSSTQPETPAQPASVWLTRTAALLTPRRIRAQAIVLALCLWVVCAIDFSTPGLFDRAGNIKFQDFLPLYASARLISQGRSAELYDQQIAADEMQRTIHQEIDRAAAQGIDQQRPRSNAQQLLLVQLPNLYGPQVGLLFVPLARLSFQSAARIWVALSLLLFFACIYLVWKFCPRLRPYPGLVAISAIAFPPLFHFFVRGQISALPLACFTAAFLAFRADRRWLAGLALGLLILKPQFLVAIPLILLLSHAWEALAGLLLSAATQLAFTWIYFGSAVMRAYFDMLRHVSRWMGAAELSLAPIQMHSLRSFWSLLIPWPPTPWPEVSFALYALSSAVAVVIAAAAWKSSSSLALRFSALTVAAVLVNPHLFVYDLLVLAPALLLLVDWILTHAPTQSSAALSVLVYLAFVLPLFGPFSRWTHVQFSVAAMAVLLWALWRISKTQCHKLASNESADV